MRDCNQVFLSYLMDIYFSWFQLVTPLLRSKRHTHVQPRVHANNLNVVLYRQQSRAAPWAPPLHWIYAMFCELAILPSAINWLPLWHYIYLFVVGISRYDGDQTAETVSDFLNW